MMDAPTAGPRVSLRRDREQGMIAGVALGIARSFGVDVTFVRLAFVLATVFAGGIGLVIYLAAWISMPPLDEADRAAGGPAADATGAWRSGAGNGTFAGRSGAFWFGIALIAIGTFTLLNTLIGPLWTPRLGQLIGPLLLILIGVLVWRSSRGDDGATPSTADATAGMPRTPEGGDGPDGTARPARRSFEAAIEDFGEDIEQVGRRLEDWEERVEARRRAARAAAPPVGSLTAGTALLTLGGLWLATELGLANVSLSFALGATLLVVGVGLLVAAFVGSGRGPIWLGLLLTPVLLISLALPRDGIPIGWSTEEGVVRLGSSQDVIRPVALDEYGSGVERPVGELTVDLRDLDRDVLRAAGRSEFTITLGVGDLLVLLPDDVTVEILAEVGVGRLEAPGRSSGGLGLRVDDLVLTPVGADANDATVLILHVEVGVGRLVFSPDPISTRS